ncbi:MAG: anthranilate synthase component I family protein [Planctomycetota bacterium]|nr:MAG: anthranilate synthase component I family protein [Planctomycetota bacterium]
MIEPRAAIRQLEAGRAVALVRERPADLLTPLGALLRLEAAAGCAPEGTDAFLFESVERAEQIGRYSFVGLAPHRAAAALPATELLASLRSGCNLARTGVDGGAPPFLGGSVFCLDWELVYALEPRLGTPPPSVGRAVTFPTVVVFDHLYQRLLLAHQLVPGGDPARAYEAGRVAIEALEDALARPLGGLQALGVAAVGAAPAPEVSLDDEAFAERVARARELIAAGDAFQIVLSRRFARPSPAAGIDLYRALRAINPSPYMFYLRFGDDERMGASPELLCRVRDGMVTTHPIAGTRPRGTDAAVDAERARELLADPKERAEHAMLVDLARNDIGRVARAGTVELSRHMQIERFSHVIHLVSEVRGRLAPGRDPVDALCACFPAGTVSGAPKVRAMEIIHELEPLPRGPYAGAVGVCAPGGYLDTCIAIRCARRCGTAVSWQAGAGVVYDSVPEREAAETRAKARAVERALALAEGATGDGPGSGEG